MSVLCVDFGSTFTKAVLLDTGSGRAEGTVLATASVPTTARTDVLQGYAAARRQLADACPAVGEPEDVLACSSAGGGLRLAVVGYERDVTAEAGHRVGLSAGARVVHIQAGPMDREDVAALRGSRPDVVLLVGGTDGGNAEVLLHNARALAGARLRCPVVVAGNAEAAGAAHQALEQLGPRVVVADNVLPRIGVIAPDAARAAIRAVFLRHVIGGKGLSRGPAFARMVRAATPDAMLSGVGVLAAVAAGDVLVVDVGGATTDVYSALEPQGEDARGSGLAAEVVAPLWHARTVEGDLGVRWNATGILRAAAAEGLTDAADPALWAYARAVEQDPGHLPSDDRERRQDLELARFAAVVAVRRHARASSGSAGDAAASRLALRPLQDVEHVVGSGGVLRAAPLAAGRRLLAAVTGDHAGGWKVPARARTGVDTAYLLFAAGLLADVDPSTAAAVAAQVLGSGGMADGTAGGSKPPGTRRAPD